MWPFKKKTTGQIAEVVKIVDVTKIEELPKPIPKKRTKTVEYKEQLNELGNTVITYHLLDGRKLLSHVYGMPIPQQISYGSDEQRSYSDEYKICGKLEEPIVYPLQIANSLKVAQDRIRYVHGEIVTIVDDEISPNNSMVGRIVSAKIGKTSSYKELILVAFIVDKEQTTF